MAPDKLQIKSYREVIESLGLFTTSKEEVTLLWNTCEISLKHFTSHSELLLNHLEYRHGFGLFWKVTVWRFLPKQRSCVNASGINL